MDERRNLQMFNYDRMVHVIVGYFRAEKYWAGLDAISFAQEKHGEQMRQSSDLKYVCHPILVAYFTVLMNLPPVYAAIALLHDVIEDAHADFSALPGGKIVQNSVKMLTIYKIRPNESKPDVKLRYFGRIDEDIIALIVKMFDRLANLTSMVGSKSEESIIKNIIETEEQLLPAVKRARRSKDLEFRKQRDVLFVVQQIVRSINEPLATLFNVPQVQRKKHDIARTHARLEGRLEVKDENGDFFFAQSDMALMVAYESTEKFKNGDSKGLCAMLLAAFAIAFGIEDDNAVATILLANLDGFNPTEFNSEIQKSLRRLRMIPLEGEAPEKTVERYYAELALNKEALLAKTLYRWIEICYGQMKNGGEPFSDEELEKIVVETDEYLIPALEYGKNNFGEFSSIFEFMTMILRLCYETIATYKNIHLPKMEGLYEGKTVG